MMKLMVLMLPLVITPCLSQTKDEYSNLNFPNKMNMSCWVWSCFIRILYIPRSFFFFLRFIMFWSCCFCLCIHRGVRCDSLDICQPCSGSAFMHSFLPIHGLGLDMGLWPRPQVLKNSPKVKNFLSFMMKPQF